MVVNALGNFDTKSIEDQKNILDKVDSIVAGMSRDLTEDVQNKLDTAKDTLKLFITSEISGLNVAVANEDDLEKKQDLVDEAQANLDLAEELGLDEAEVNHYQNMIDDAQKQVDKAVEAAEKAALEEYKDEKVKVLGFLDNLTEEEINEFASRIYVAADKDAVDAIMEEAFDANLDQDVLELAEYKDAKVKILSFLDNLTQEEKDAFASKIYVAADTDAVDAILEEAFDANLDQDVLELAEYKDAKVKVLSFLNNLTQEEKDAFASKIYVAKDTDAVDAIMKEAFDANLDQDVLELAEYKDAKVKVLSFLNNLTQEEKDAFASKIYVAADKDAVDAILEEAFHANLDQDALELAEYKDAKVKILSFLNNLTQEEKDAFASRIYVAEDTDTVDAIMEEAFGANLDEDVMELARYKDEKVKVLVLSDNLTEEEINEFASRIYVASDKDAIDAIMEEVEVTE